MPLSIAETIAIIPAAGSGVRMGGVPKALLKIGQLTVIELSLRSIIQSEVVSEVLICVREQDRLAFESLDLQSRYPGCPVTLVAGGEVRQASVFNGLEYIRKQHQVTSELCVLVHDAARCLVSSALVRRCVEGAQKWGAVTAAVPLTDSIKRAGTDMQVLESLERENIWCVQTPQVFGFDLLYAAHTQKQTATRSSAATDDASLVEMLHSVKIVEGEKSNFKITTPEDLQLARCLLQH